MSKITYDDKVALNENPEIADINKVTDDDMNEIKQVVNDNANTLDNLLSNTYGTSQTEGYSQEYINNNVGVVDSGSNNNGSYIKFADGTMICYQSQLFSNYQITGTQGVLYTTTLTPNDYPVAFVGNLPIVSRSIKSTTWAVYGFGSNNTTAPSLTNSGSFEIFRGSSTGTGTVNTIIDIIAIGRWK